MNFTGINPRLSAFIGGYYLGALVPLLESKFFLDSGSWPLNSVLPKWLCFFRSPAGDFHYMSCKVLHNKHLTHSSPDSKMALFGKKTVVPPYFHLRRRGKSKNITVVIYRENNYAGRNQKAEKRIISKPEPMIKRRLRKQLRKTVKQLSEQQTHLQSIRACELLCQTEQFQQARVIMLFLAITKEIETQSAIQQALGRGKLVAVPKVIYKDHQLVPVRLLSLDCEMETDRYGLRHPLGTEEMDVAIIDLVVAPGLGFDIRGNRLGRGGGYYDRFFTLDGFRAVKCGLSFEEQLVDEIPMFEHDISLDMLVTDKTVRRFDISGDHRDKNYQDTGAKDG
jgi:5-formyltetrahydrofolate cyclo-ligase